MKRIFAVIVMALTMTTMADADISMKRFRSMSQVQQMNFLSSLEHSSLGEWAYSISDSGIVLQWNLEKARKKFPQDFVHSTAGILILGQTKSKDIALEYALRQAAEDVMTDMIIEELGFAEVDWMTMYPWYQSFRRIASRDSSIVPQLLAEADSLFASIEVKAVPVWGFMWWEPNPEAPAEEKRKFHDALKMKYLKTLRGENPHTWTDTAGEFRYR